jgi:hypothetical protein
MFVVPRRRVTFKDFATILRGTGLIEEIELFACSGIVIVIIPVIEKSVIIGNYLCNLVFVFLKDASFFFLSSDFSSVTAIAA